MKITQGEIEDRQTVLRVELEDDDIATYLDQGYRRLVQRTSIPGFRKGKAPRRIVENFLGRESLINEVIDSMLPEVTTKAITEQPGSTCVQCHKTVINPFGFAFENFDPIGRWRDRYPKGGGNIDPSATMTCICTSCPAICPMVSAGSPSPIF